MNWLRSISNLEWYLVLTFVILYAIYFIKLYLLSKTLNISWRRAFFKLILRSAYFLLFILSLLGPSFGDIKKEIKSIGKDIYICVDISNSMNVKDINPTRLEKVKFELLDMLRHFPSDRISLIAYADNAYVQCPLTYDKNTLKMFIGSLTTTLVSKTGSQVYNAFKLVDSKPISGEDRPKVVLTITDGEDFSSNETDVVIASLQKKKYYFYFLGIGTDLGGKIPSLSGADFVKDKTGNYILSKLNRKSIESLTQQSKGKSYYLTQESNEIKSLVRSINKLEGELKGTRKIDSAANKYYYFLVLGLILLVADVMITFKTINL